MEFMNGDQKLPFLPLLFGGFGLLCSGSVVADLYKCSDGKKNVSYQDAPCANGILRKDLQRSAPPEAEQKSARDRVARMKEASQQKAEAENVERERQARQAEYAWQEAYTEDDDSEEEDDE
jgi:hypothetical protein